MNLLIFGATGCIGKQVITQALDQGHTVTAFSRDPHKLEIQHPNLKLFQGDVMDYVSVKQSMNQQEAIICVLGSGSSLTSTVRSEGTKNIIRAMEECKIHRLICQSTLGAGESWGNLNFYWKYVMFGFILRKVFADHERQEQFVQQSDLDWTIVRPGAFIEGPLTGEYKHGFSSTETTKLAITHADVADFLLKQLSTDMYLGKAPSLSY